MGIALIDYNMGNLGSVMKALKFLGTEPEVIDSAADLDRFDACLLPGVGSFGDGMENLCQRGFDRKIKEFIAQGKWFFGICLGMQMLLESSAESPGVRGLGIFDGKVSRFDDALGKVPHMGWNTIRFKPDTLLSKGIPDNTFFYFVHSFYVRAGHPDAVAETSYITDFTSALGRGHCFAAQFHPEKSQQAGLALLKNFLTAAGVLNEK